MKKVKAAGVIPDAVTPVVLASVGKDGDGDAGEGAEKKKGSKGRKDKKDKANKTWDGKNGKVETTGKSAIQLAREKFAAQDALKKELKNSKATGANSGGVRPRK